MISLWEILVPVYMKDKTEFTSISYSDKLCSDDLNYIKKKHHDIFDEFVRVRSINVTIFRSATGDLIKNNGTRERMETIKFKCNYLTAEKIVGFAKKHYQQEKIMCYKLSEDFIEV